MKPIGKVYHTIFQEVLPLFCICDGEYQVKFRGKFRWLPSRQMRIREMF